MNASERGERSGMVVGQTLNNAGSKVASTASKGAKSVGRGIVATKDFMAAFSRGIKNGIKHPQLQAPGKPEAKSRLITPESVIIIVAK